jgi:hypothetical protein
MIPLTTRLFSHWSIPLSQVFHPNDDERFPNYSKKEQPRVGKGRVQEKGRERVGADFMSKNRHFMELWHPMPELT